MLVLFLILGYSSGQNKTDKSPTAFFFFFGCVGSSLLHTGFLQLRRVRATLHCGTQASHCSGFSCCGAGALGARASVVVALRL